MLQDQNDWCHGVMIDRIDGERLGTVTWSYKTKQRNILNIPIARILFPTRGLCVTFTFSTL